MLEPSGSKLMLALQDRVDPWGWDTPSEWLIFKGMKLPDV